ncbi:MAG: alpha/beta fold hydrolase [Halobacteriota archaeon]
MCETYSLYVLKRNLLRRRISANAAAAASDSSGFVILVAMMSAKDAIDTYTTGSVTSRDGTAIGYRQLGTGPGLILVHGAVCASQHLMKLGAALCDTFTVYVPDRRGRGLSGPFGDNYGVQREIEDLDALLQETGAHSVFGHSAGALISLCAVRVLPSIHKVALYEPPLDIDNAVLSTLSFMPRFDREIREGDVPGAMATFLKAFVRNVEPSQARLSFVPRFLLVRLLARALRDDAENVRGDDVPLQELIPTYHFEHQLVIDTQGTLTDFTTVRAEALLLCGSKSPSNLRAAVRALSNVLPNVTCVELQGLSHSAPVDSPERVAPELRRFFLVK